MLVWSFQCLVNTHQPNGNDFCLVTKRTCCVTLSLWNLRALQLSNSRCFLSNAVFNGSNWEKNSCLNFFFFFSWKSLQRTPIPLYTQHHFIGWRSTLHALINDDSFHLLCNLLHSTLLFLFHFSSLVTICLKNRTFSLCLSIRLYNWSMWQLNIIICKPLLTHLIIHATFSIKCTNHFVIWFEFLPFLKKRICWKCYLFSSILESIHKKKLILTIFKTTFTLIQQLWQYCQKQSCWMMTIKTEYS